MDYVILDVSSSSSENENEKAMSVSDEIMIDEEIKIVPDYIEYKSEEKYIKNEKMDTIPKVKTKTKATSTGNILKDLSVYPLPPEIKVYANNIFKNLNITIIRRKRRKKVIYFCVFQTYKELSKPFDPVELLSMLGLDNTDRGNAFSMCAETKTGYQVVPKRYIPQDFLKFYMEKTRIPREKYEEISEILEDVLRKDPYFYENYPQIVAKATILYYSKINGIKVKEMLESLKIQRIDSTLHKLIERITIVHNYSED